MLAELSQDPDSGLIGYRLTFGPGGPVVVQYWNSHEKLYAYASAPDAEHRPAWTAFNRRIRKAPGSVGIWHETYLVDRAETIYAHMAPAGLAKATVRHSGGSPRRAGQGTLGPREGGLSAAYPVPVTAPEPGWYADPAGVAQNHRTSSRASSGPTSPATPWSTRTTRSPRTGTLRWVAVLDDPLIVPGDLGQTAGKVATTLQAFYPAGQVTIRKRKLEDLNGIAPPGKSVLLSMELHLSVKDLPTAYDKLLIAVVELADGEYATWFAASPNDAPKDVSKALKSSAATVTANP